MQVRVIKSGELQYSVFKDLDEPKSMIWFSDFYGFESNKVEMVFDKDSNNVNDIVIGDILQITDRSFNAFINVKAVVNAKNGDIVIVAKAERDNLLKILQGDV